MARPRKKISKEEFEKLCGLQCTIEEMCCYFECGDKTLNAWCKRTYKASFSEVFKIKRGSGKISLRRKQFETAMSGNPTLLIWLGKQYLGQGERIETESKVNVSDNFVEALNKTAAADWQESENDDDTSTDI